MLKLFSHVRAQTLQRREGNFELAQVHSFHRQHIECIAGMPIELNWKPLRRPVVGTLAQALEPPETSEGASQERSVALESRTATNSI